MSEPKLFDQALQTLGFFKRVQVFALDIFNQRHRCSGFVRYVAHQHGYAVQAGNLGSSKAAFTGNDFVFAVVWPGG